MAEDHRPRAEHEIDELAPVIRPDRCALAARGDESNRIRQLKGAETVARNEVRARPVARFIWIVPSGAAVTHQEPSARFESCFKRDAVDTRAPHSG